jgi:non-heme chloroperoxidase
MQERPPNEGEHAMSKVKTKDGVEIFYKDWGKGQPIVFSHGWPLSADDWDAQMMFFATRGYRVIAHDRRGHGRSTQTSDGHDMDHYADDLAAVTTHLDLKNAVHVGHSTGGGEVVHYLARHGQSRVAKAAIISAVPPLMVKTAANPGGLPKEVFDNFQAQVATNRAQFYRDVPAGPFYGFNRPGAKPSEGIIQNWWRQGMMGGAKAHYDGIVAFSQTDFTDDLKKITVPVLVMHGDDDQIVPYADAAPLSAKLLKKGTLKTYKGFPHGMPTTQAETINADLLSFVKS